MNLHDFISNANNPQLGSFGESVFYDFIKKINISIKKTHYARSDFEVNNQRFDVKTSRKNITKFLTIPKLNFRNRAPSVCYAGIEFHTNGILLSIEGNLIEQLCWEKAESTYQKWQSGYYGKSHIPRVKNHNILPKVLKVKIQDIFDKLNIARPYLLFRTVEFDGESPHNLLPSQRELDKRLGWTLFLVFKKSPPIEGNLGKIIIFPDSSDFELQRLPKTRTSSHIKNLEKADLKRIPEKFITKRLDDIQRILTANDVK
jgi:hypothetical protein